MDHGLGKSSGGERKQRMRIAFHISGGPGGCGFLIAGQLQRSGYGQVPPSLPILCFKLPKVLLPPAYCIIDFCEVEIFQDYGRESDAGSLCLQLKHGQTDSPTAIS